MNYGTIVFPVITVILLCIYFFRYGTLLRSNTLRQSGPFQGETSEKTPEAFAEAVTAENTQAADRPLRKPHLRFSWPRAFHRMERRDIRPLCIILALYTVAAFAILGDTQAPQTFRQFSQDGESVTLELRYDSPITKIMYYTGLYSGSYTAAFSSDGVNYSYEAELPQGHGDLFKWLEVTFSGEDMPQAVKYIRIASSTKLELGELAIYGEGGYRIPNHNILYDDGCAALFDEEAYIPDTPSYMNSAYFDEIYHARTAYENVTNVYPYEVSHPPLGKLIISIGIQLFDMTPFGWRCMGALFGVIMLLPLYMLIKSIFGSTAIASCGTLIFAFDFMHYTQTRIATIDTYAVFFILFMYLFMYRFIASNPDGPRSEQRQAYLYLALAGLAFGLGAASKWTVIYAGAGLALLWLLYWIFRFLALRREGRMDVFFPALLKNILWCLLFFVFIPCAIYYISYYPYGKASGMSGFSMFLNPDYLEIVLENQEFMFTYHSGLESTHPYSASWYQWIFDIRPILYYRSYADGGLVKSAIAAFVNPLLCWGGLLAILSMAYLSIARRDSKALFILLGYLAQLAPWFLVSRLTFEYHYFPSTVFLTLALCHVFNTIRERRPNWRRAVYGYTAACLVLFAAFFPVLSGLPVPVWYTSNFLRWLPSLWPL